MLSREELARMLDLGADITIAAGSGLVVEKKKRRSDSADMVVIEDQAAKERYTFVDGQNAGVYATNGRGESGYIQEEDGQKQFLDQRITVVPNNKTGITVLQK